jgi:hypothetical protein
MESSSEYFQADRAEGCNFLPVGVELLQIRPSDVLSVTKGIVTKVQRLQKGA